MRIYKPVVAEGFEWAQPIDEDDFRIFRHLGPGVDRSTWIPVPFWLVREDEGQTFAESDFPWLGSDTLILRERAVDLLGDLIAPYGELLPLECDEAVLAAFNVHRIIDALDERRSTVVRYPSSGRVMAIERHAFAPEIVGEAVIFKIPEVGSTYVTDEFVNRVETAGLRGLDFPMIWESGSDPTPTRALTKRTSS